MLLANFFIFIICSEATSQKKKLLQSAKDLHLSQRFDEIKSNITNVSLKQCLDLKTEKSARSWLTALPLKDHDFCFNKREFRDLIYLRYEWSFPNTPHTAGVERKTQFITL